MERIAIIGDGRFGKFLLHQIRLQGMESICIGIHPTPKDIGFLSESTCTIFAVPIRETLRAMRSYQEQIPRKSLVMDVCSVKTLPCQWLLDVFGGDSSLTLIGTHPLFGPQSVPIPQSCAGQRIALCPVQMPLHDMRQPMELWAKVMGLNVIECSPEEHDRQCCTQMIDHFVGRAAKSCGIDRVPMSTKTHELFMNIVDIVNGNSKELFEDMNSFNPYAPQMRATFIQSLVAIDAELDSILTEEVA